MLGTKNGQGNCKKQSANRHDFVEAWETVETVCEGNNVVDHRAKATVLMIAAAF